MKTTSHSLLGMLGLSRPHIPKRILVGAVTLGRVANVAKSTLCPKLDDHDRAGS